MSKEIMWKGKMKMCILANVWESKVMVTSEKGTALTRNGTHWSIWEPGGKVCLSCKRWREQSIRFINDCGPGWLTDHSVGLGFLKLAWNIKRDKPLKL